MTATLLATTPGALGPYVLYPSNSTQSAILADGSLIFLVSEGSDTKLYQCLNPSGNSPTASVIETFSLGGAGENTSVFISGSDVWVGIGENETTGGAWIAHNTYSGGVWGTWDGPTSCVANLVLAAANNFVSCVWTGTYLIAIMRGSVGGLGAAWINYTTDKTGKTGWLASALQLSSTSSATTHYFGGIVHDATLGCTVAVYSIAGDPIKSRVLPDSSTPALANWGAETDLGTGNISLADFQGASVLLDHVSGDIFVAYYDMNASPPKSPGFVVGTITVNGASSAVTWGSPIAVGAASANADSPALAIDSGGKVFILFATGADKAASDIAYATSVSPYTSVSAVTNVTNASANQNNHPAPPTQARLTAGYVPLLYLSGASAPYNVMYDTSIAAQGSGGGLLLRHVNT